MTFIRTTPAPAAAGAVREMYQEVERRSGFLPNWAAAFSLRPDVWRGWDTMHAAIRSHLPVRTYELVTLAAARALHSSYCSLAHGRVLAENVLDAETVAAIMRDPATAPLEPQERALVAFAEQVARHADRIGPADIQALRDAGYDDETIFDAAATAAARCFFSKLLDALGVQADARYRDLAPELRTALTVGRPIADPVPAVAP